MNLLLLGVSGVSLLQLKWVSLDRAILESLRKVTLGRMNWNLGLKTASGDVRCSWQWFPKPWKSTWPTVVCFSFPGKETKTRILSCTENRSAIKPFSSWFYCSMALLSIKMSLRCNSVLHQRAQSMHGNFKRALCFAVKKHGERKSSMFC